MQSRAARLGVLGALIVVAVVLFVVLKDNGDGDEADGGGTATSTAAKATTVPTPPEGINVNDGKPVGGVRTLTYEKGDEVNLLVTLAPPEEAVHVHGYEIEKSAESGVARLSFKADIDGVFEVEVHRTDGTEAEIAELQINP
jgi:hypothetical protein